MSKKKNIISFKEWKKKAKTINVRNSFVRFDGEIEKVIITSLKHKKEKSKNEQNRFDEKNHYKSIV